MESFDWKKLRSVEFKGWQNERRTEFLDQLPFVLKEAAVTATPSDLLWTAEVYVDGIAVVLQGLCRCKDLIWVVSAELDNEGSVEQG